MNLTRRSLIFGGLAAPVLARKERPPERPNVLLILADGLPFWMLSVNGNKEVRTPNIDQLSQSGVRFQNHFVCTPASSPSCATLFTGRVPRQHGIQDFLTGEPIENPPQGQAAPPASFKNETMLSDLLAAAGYECGYAGKWHMGDNQQPQHGFRFWYTNALSGPTAYDNPSMNWNGQVVQEKGYLTELATAKAGEFLDKQTPGKPFFLTLGYLNPHAPYEGHPARYYQMYSQTNFETTGWEHPASNALRGKEYLKSTVENLRKVAASVTALDDQIPALLAKLNARGLQERTLIIVSSASGSLFGRHGLWGGGLASNPINMHDEVLATPMIWRWLGRIPAQSVRPEVVSSYDFMPTLCELLQVSPPAGRNLCGRSYLPLALNERLPKKWRWRKLIFGQYRNTEMARDTRFKLVLRNDGAGPNEFYDLADDPREKVNQHENQKYLLDERELVRSIEEWRKTTSV